jgi:hypothetical protein
MQCEIHKRDCGLALDRLACVYCDDSATNPCTFIAEYKRWRVKKVLCIEDRVYNRLHLDMVPNSVVVSQLRTDDENSTQHSEASISYLHCI